MGGDRQEREGLICRISWRSGGKNDRTFLVCRLLACVLHPIAPSQPAETIARGLVYTFPDPALAAATLVRARCHGRWYDRSRFRTAWQRLPDSGPVFARAARRP